MLLNLFKNTYKYSEFAYLGNLENYTLDSIKLHVKKMQIKEQQIGSLIYLQFTDPYTKIVLSYHLDGQFNKIESQKFAWRFRLFSI
jgi:hypothetical protein